MEFFETNPAFKNHLMLLDDRGNQVTYGDFEEFCGEIPKDFGGRKLLFLLCENTIGSVFFYLAALRRGVVPLLLEKDMNRELLGALKDTYEPDFVAAPEPADGPASGGEILFSAYGYELCREKKNTCTKLHEDLALLLTTSGSTGSPKLVRQSYKNIAANAASIAGYLHLDATERPITTLPMNYTYGLSILNSHFLVGAAVLLTTKTLFEREFWEFFRSAGATSFGGVPYTYEMLKRLSFFQMELPTLRIMTQAGGKLSPKLHGEFAEYAKETGREFVVMYGQTEATARMGWLPPEKAIEKRGSMGIAIPGGRFRLMEDAHTEITAPDVVGELVYEGDNVTMGYAQCAADLSKGDERGGILFTGDMAKRDVDGFYYITGRKKRFLKLYGKRVNMDEMEQLMKAEYGEIQVACTGEDDHMRIYAAGASEDFCRSAEAWLAEKTGLHPGGFQVLPIEKIPKNEAGKTIYKDLP